LIDSASRSALVTGSASGIGAGVARYLGSLGHRVILLDIDGVGVQEVAEAVRGAGGQAVGIQADVADEVAVRAAMADGCRQLGVVEILVNNAGFARDGNLVDMSVDDWDAVIATPDAAEAEPGQDLSTAGGGGVLLRVALGG
jgi:NAD(P)-dependent dehydrogenase (short-subunit alcohol dehydrogenase family)